LLLAVVVLGLGSRSRCLYWYKTKERLKIRKKTSIRPDARTGSQKEDMSVKIRMCDNPDNNYLSCLQLEHR
jgi:hypothetical protein